MLAEEIPQAIQWHEGMLLAPQHFQQSWRRQEMLVQYTSLISAPFFWGVRRLAIDEKLLPSGIVRVLDLEAILPDGAVVTHKPNTGRELTIDLSVDSSLPRQADITVSLALPAGASASIKGVLPRYEALESEPLVDENTGEGDLRVPVMRPRLLLFAGATPPPKYVSMPLLRVRFEDEGCVQTDFVPPMIQTPLHSPLGALAAGLARRLREKATYLSEQARSTSAASDLPLLIEARSHLQALAAGLPPFEALLSSGMAHPFTLYLSMCGLAGHLAALGSSLVPPVFAPYNQNDPRASFQEVLNFALSMANEGIPENYTVYPLKLKDRVFAVMFQEQWMSRRLVLGVRASQGMTEKDVIAWGEECLIGSESVIPVLRDRRVRGTPRQQMDRDEELAPVRGVVLFSLRPERDFVRPGETLQILNFSERWRSTMPLEVVLYVRRGGE